MKEIRFNKISHNAILVFEVCMIVIYCYLTVYFVHSLITANETPDILLKFVMPVFCLVLAYGWLLIDIVFYVRFYGLRVKLLNDKLILSTNNRECQIPTGEDTNVIYCMFMFGWLIIWPSGNKINMILLRKNFFMGRHEKELREYLKLYMNYISSKEEKKRLLKSLHINVFNPLKYIKWPA